MSIEENAGNAAPENADNVASQEDVSNQSVDNVADEGKVDYSNYRRQVSKTRNLQSALEKERAEKESLLQAKLEAEGNKDELITSLRKEVNEWKNKASSAVSNFAKSKVHEVLMSEAAKIGCQDPELIMMAYGNDIDSIEFDDSFNPDRDQIRMTLDRIKNERPQLFSKPAPNVGNHQIKTGDKSTKKTKTLSSMDDKELMEAWSKSNG